MIIVGVLYIHLMTLASLDLKRQIINVNILRKIESLKGIYGRPIVVTLYTVFSQFNLFYLGWKEEIS